MQTSIYFYNVSPMLGVSLDERVQFSTRTDVGVRFFGLFLGNYWAGFLKNPLSVELFNDD